MITILFLFGPGASLSILSFFFKHPFQHSTSHSDYLGHETKLVATTHLVHSTATPEPMTRLWLGLDLNPWPLCYHILSNKAQANWPSNQCHHLPITMCPLLLEANGRTWECQRQAVLLGEHRSVWGPRCSRLVQYVPAAGTAWDTLATP